MNVLAGSLFPWRRLDALPHALREARRRFTWRVAGVALLIGLVFEVWSLFDAWRGESPYQGYVSGVIVNLLMAFSLTGVALAADELVTRGSRRLPTYACAVVAGSALGAAVYWMIHSWIPAPQSWREPVLPPATITLRLFFEYLIWGAIGASIYARQRAALHAADRLNAARVHAARSRRGALQSRLLALQARVEPQFLSNTLTQIRDTYDRDAAAGARMLDDLIAYLRASLPHLQDSGLSLAQELTRAQAYFGIVAPQLQLSVCAAPAALAASMAAMVLLPLVECVAPAAATFGGRLQIAASVTGGMLRVAVSSERVGGCVYGSDDPLQTLRRRLSDLYADRAVITVLPHIETGRGLVIQIPYEPSNRDHS
ncbi:MAG: histidine kinase [Steroidobacteraceae bacterium]